MAEPSKSKSGLSNLTDKQRKENIEKALLATTKLPPGATATGTTGSGQQFTQTGTSQGTVTSINSNSNQALTPQEVQASLLKKQGADVTVSKTGEVIAVKGGTKTTITPTGEIVRTPTSATVDSQRVSQLVQDRARVAAQQKTTNDAYLAKPVEDKIDSTSFKLYIKLNNTIPTGILGQYHDKYIQPFEKTTNPKWIQYAKVKQYNKQVEAAYNKLNLSFYQRNEELNKSSLIDKAFMYGSNLYSEFDARAKALAQRVIPSWLPGKIQQVGESERKVNMFRYPQEIAKSVLNPTIKLTQGTKAEGFAKAINESADTIPREIIPFSYNVAAGFTKEARENPTKAAVTAGAFFLLPPALKLGGKAVAPLASAFPKTASALSKTVSIGLPVAYGGSVAYRTATAENKGETLGRIGASEITPMLAGTYAATRFFPMAEGYFRTMGRTERATEKLVPPEVISGEKNFPTAPPEKHLQIFESQKYALPGRVQIYNKPKLKISIVDDPQTKFKFLDRVKYSDLSKFPEKDVIINTPQQSGKIRASVLRRIGTNPYEETSFSIAKDSVMGWPIEPQVSPAIKILNKKGYRTFSSGFGGQNQVIDLAETLPDESIRLARSLGADVRRLEGPGYTYTSLSIPQKGKSLSRVSEIFTKVAEDLPVNPLAKTTKKIRFEIVKEKNIDVSERPKAMMYHAAPQPVKDLTVGEGSSELPGLYGSSAVSAYFLKLGNAGESSLYGGSLFEPYSTPQVLAITPKGFRVNPAFKTAEGYQFGKPTKLGYADIPKIKTEIEAILPPETKLVPTNKQYFFKWKGARVPIDEFSALGAEEGAAVRAARSLKEVSPEYSLTTKSSFSTPGSLLGGIGLSSYNPETSRVVYSSRNSYSKPQYSYQQTSSSSKVYDTSSRLISESSKPIGSSKVSGSSRAGSSSTGGSSYNPPSYNPPSSPPKYSSYSPPSPPSYKPPYSPPRRSPPYYPPNRTPPYEPPSTPFFPRRDNNIGSGAFDVLVKRFGKYKTLATGLPEGRALKAGSDYAKRTLGATFKIIPKGVSASISDINFRPDARLFRDYRIIKGQKVYTGEFIQEAFDRLSSGSEKSEIRSYKKSKGRLWKFGAK